jgi:hypothetical protein
MLILHLTPWAVAFKCLQEFSGRSGLNNQAASGRGQISVFIVDHSLTGFRSCRNMAALFRRCYVS